MDYLLTLFSVTVFTLMLTIGIEHSPKILWSFWRKPADAIKCLLAVLLVVPVLVAILIFAFKLPAGVASGMALLAAAPGAPLTTKRAIGAGAHASHVGALQLSLALLAVVVTPMILSLFYSLSEVDTEQASVLKVAYQVLTVTFFPVLLGFAARCFAPDLTEKVSGPLSKIANILFLLLMVVVVVALVAAPDLRSSLRLGWLALFAITLFAVFALATGHLIGGTDREEKSALAMACLARNLGLALFVAQKGGVVYQVMPTILAYALIGSVLGILYSIWSKRSVRNAANSG